MTLYHCTTPKKEKRYYDSGHICRPVRGFTTLEAAMLWGLEKGRDIILEINGETAYKLPDHHNKFGEAWWIDNNVSDMKRKAIRVKPENPIAIVKRKDNLLLSIVQHFKVLDNRNEGTI